MTDLEARIRRLEDIEAIRQLKYRYCAFCDDNYNPHGIASLFVEDGVWDGGAVFGKAEGPAAIADYFSKTPDLVKFAVHQVLNPRIDVDGDAATGQWYLFQPMVLHADDQALWLIANYDELYVRTVEGWRFRRLTLTIQRLSPTEQGFGKVPMFDL